MTRQLLERLWLETAARAGLAKADAATIFSDLCRRYSEPERAYHTLDHVAAMLDMISGFTDTMEDETVVRLAVWFHDAVYDARRTDNEEQSAVYALAVLKDGAVSAAVERLILATKTHQSSPGDTDCQLLLDADLAILGAPLQDYDRYARAIREEYLWVPEAEYRAGRRKVLAGFLGRDRLFYTPPLFERLEQPARGNLRREIESLASSPL